MSTREARRAGARRPATKAARQARIAAILAREQVHSQEQLAGLLSQYAGMHVTQATLSRDLDELGVVRLRAAGRHPGLRAARRSRRAELPPGYRLRLSGTGCGPHSAPHRFRTRGRQRTATAAARQAATSDRDRGRQAARTAGCRGGRRPGGRRRPAGAAAAAARTAPAQPAGAAWRRLAPPGQVPQGAADLGGGERQPGRAAHARGRGPVPRLGHRPRRLARHPRHGGG